MSKHTQSPRVYPYSGVYRITNTVTGDTYIGSSNDTRRRWYEHRRRLQCGTHDNSHLQRAWLRYESLAFELTVLELCTPDLLITVEQRYIDTERPAYNMAPIAGQGPGMRGKKHSAATLEKLSRVVFTEERRAAMRAAHRIRWTPEARQQRSESQKGKKRTPAAIEKSRQALIGRTVSEETRRKIGVANAGKPHGPHKPETVEKMRQFQRERRRAEKERGVTISDAHRRHLQNLHASAKGRKHSEETRQKMSAAHKARLAK